MADAEGLDAVFRPKSIAVIGASREAGTVGHEILRNLVLGGFAGSVHPVNPHAEAVHSIACRASVLDIEGPVDLAVVCVPSRVVLQVAGECREKGVGALCVITAGFRETGPAGLARELELRALCREGGMRLVGPNCMGVLNASADIRMNATIAPTFPRPGSVAFLSQSGAMGVSILDQAADMDLGIRMFASIGNKADVSGNDLLAYWEHDEGTRVVLMYLESFGNPRKFIPLARRISRTRPIVCVKAGRTAEAAQAASSHTGALAGADVAVDALLEQAGVLRVDTVRELFDTAQALTTQPLPAGDRVAVLTNAGGPGILTVDFLLGRGLGLAALSAETRERLADILPPEASTANPVDMIAGAGAEEYAGALPVLLDDEGVDAVILIFVPPVHVDPQAVAQAIFDVARDATKPVFACFMAREQVLEAMTHHEQGRVPVYTFPEEAVRSLHNLLRVQRLRDDDLGRTEVFDDIDHEAIEALLDRACGETTAGGSADAPPMLGAPVLGERGGWLSAEDVWTIYKAAGIPAAAMTVAPDADHAVAAARAFDGPVALKLDGEAFLHKSDLGAVKLGLEGDEAVREAAQALTRIHAEHAPEAPLRIVVQAMIEDGIEIVLGSRSDPVFGPVLMVGLGGIHVEIMKDVAFGVVPMTRVIARRMLRRLKAFPLLDGARGRAPVDLEAIETVLLRLAEVVATHPRILEVDANPLMATPGGLVAVDGRMRAGPPFGPAEAR